MTDNKYQPSYSIEFTPHAEWLKLATGKVRGYRWWVIGPLSFHVIWSHDAKEKAQ